MMREAVTNYCKSCRHDPEKPGRWRQQVSLCPKVDCPLWCVRPMTYEPIPEEVLTWYEAAQGPFPPLLVRRLVDLRRRRV